MGKTKIGLHLLLTQSNFAVGKSYEWASSNIIGRKQMNIFVKSIARKPVVYLTLRVNTYCWSDKNL